MRKLPRTDRSERVIRELLNQANKLATLTPPPRRLVIRLKGVKHPAIPGMLRQAARLFAPPPDDVVPTKH